MMSANGAFAERATELGKQFIKFISSPLPYEFYLIEFNPFSLSGRTKGDYRHANEERSGSAKIDAGNSAAHAARHEAGHAVIESMRNQTPVSILVCRDNDRWVGNCDFGTQSASEDDSVAKGIAGVPCAHTIRRTGVLATENTARTRVLN